jgi:hypothetical protein
LDKDKYLMKQCFDNWNAVKRFQTKEEIEREKGMVDEARKMELMKYKAQAKLELSMRALQREISKEEDTEES